MRNIFNKEENSLAVVIKLVKLLKINVTSSAIMQIKDHPSYPSVKSIADLLESWRIKSLVVKVGINQLAKIPYPAIAHIQKSQGHFVVLRKFENGTLHYWDSEQGDLSVTADEFAKEWTGATLLVETNSNSGEVDYRYKKRIEVLNQILKVTCVFLLCLLVGTALILLPNKLMIPFMLQVAGSGLAVLLLRKQFGFTSSIWNSVCHIGTKLDCDSVINSPASKILGSVHLTELSMLYFVGGAMSIFIGALIGRISLDGLFVLSILSVILSGYTVYYQGTVLKKWCSFCMIITAILWIQFIYFIAIRPSYFDNTISGEYFGFIIILLFWIFIRNEYGSSLKTKAIENGLVRISKNENLFLSLLKHGQRINANTFDNEICFGSSQADVSIILLTSPTCLQCALTHRILEEMLHDGEIQMRIRFVANPANTNSTNLKVASHFLSLKLEGSKEKFSKAISAWFANQNQSPDKWINDFKSLDPEKNSRVKEIITEQFKWATNEGLLSTPTMIINNHVLPEIFTIEDVRFHIKAITRAAELLRSN